MVSNCLNKQRVNFGTGKGTDRDDRLLLSQLPKPSVLRALSVRQHDRTNRRRHYACAVASRDLTQLEWETACR